MIAPLSTRPDIQKAVIASSLPFPADFLCAICLSPGDAQAPACQASRLPGTLSSYGGFICCHLWPFPERWSCMPAISLTVFLLYHFYIIMSIYL